VTSAPAGCGGEGGERSLIPGAAVYTRAREFPSRTRYISAFTMKPASTSRVALVM
jgi:hypothetical protein